MKNTPKCCLPILFIPKTNAAKKITRSGVSDEGLFDIVNVELLKGFSSATGKERIDLMAWLCKALASSGMEKYIPTLEQVAQQSSNPKLQKYANQSIDLVAQYAERNKIMADAVKNNPGMDPEIAKVLKMLQSDVMTLKKDAAKMITRNDYADPAIYATVSEQLMKGYAAATDKNSADTMAWLCKALGASGDKKYQTTLETVANGTHNPVIKKYAKQALAMLY